MRRLGGGALALLLCAFAIGAPTHALAAAADARTLVVRGRVLAPDGSPVTGARVMARGSASLAAESDSHGKYSLSIPIGSAAGLRRGAFTLDVRAEQAGRRLALGSGAPALAIEVALAPGGRRVRVRSNSQEATSAIATAFAQDRATTAWVEADFGGAVKPTGSMQMTAVDEVRLDGDAGGDSAEGAPSNAAPRRPRVDSLPRPAARAISAADLEAAWRDSVARARRQAAAAPLVTKARTDSLARLAEAARVRNAAAAERRLARARRDSLARAQAESTAHAQRSALSAASSLRDSVARANAAAAAAQASARRDSVSHAQTASLAASRAARAAAHAARDSVRAAHARARHAAARAVPSAAGSPPPATGRAEDRPARAATPVTSQVPLAARTAASAADTCRCLLRGTVEVEWERPLERNFPIELSLEGPQSRQGEVDMFIGSPREFRFADLPCGDYRLVVHSRGKLRYVLERGDSVVTVACRGLTQARVVLVPAKR